MPIIVQLFRLPAILGACAALAALTLSAGDVRAADPAAEQCNHYVERGLFENKGECMKRYKTGPVRLCKWLEDWGYFDRPWARFKNKGECISNYKS